MANLVDILNSIREKAEIKKFGTLSPDVFQSLHGLSLAVEYYWRNGDRGRLGAYKEALQYFADGLEDGYKGSGRGKEDYYEIGHSTATKIREEIEKAKTKGLEAEALSYQTLMGQLRGIIPILKAELEALIQADNDPYNLLLTQIQSNNKGHGHIAEGLTALISSCRDLIEGLFSGTVGEEFIRELESKKECGHAGSHTSPCKNLKISWDS